MKTDNPRKKLRSDLFMALFLLALLAFMAYQARNYANWAQEKKAERLASESPPAGK
ncbi:MAG: hypothetical protein PHV36_03475 [Elusimicrobiales bacterium]|nr:hypothetical protein [Elusimicrobiales bacterium]